jgi:hypothetical protein
VVGVSGATGVSGVVGVSGATGVSGVIGVSGATGASGVSGATGVSGVVGVSGATGVSGVVGVSGATGVSGVVGVSGATGVSGVVGVSGATGVSGVVGVSGATGVSGVSGATGVSGVVGVSGATGVSGVVGVSGATGVSGVVGVSGATGVSGVPGPAPTGVSGAVLYLSSSGVAAATSTAGSSGQFLSSTGGGAPTWSSGGTSQWTTSGTNIYYTTGNVGIGLTGPGYPLDVTGDMHCSGSFYCGNNSSATAVGSIGGRMYFGGTYGDSVYAEGGQILSRLYGGTESSELIIFKGNDIAGNPGPDRIRLRAANICFDTYSVASSDPTAESIRWTISESGNLNKNGTSVGDLAGINLPTSGTGIHWGGGVSRIYDDGDLRICTDDTMHFYTGSTSSSPGTERITLTSGGSVGIGTSGPTAKFTVYEATGTTAGGSGQGSVVIQHGNNGGSSSIVFPSAINYLGADYGYIQYNDNRTAGAENATFIIGIQNDGDDNLALLASGNIGVQTQTPGYTLDVSGTIRATGDVIAYSDRRVKTDLRLIKNALDKVSNINGYTYVRTDVEKPERQAGVIAQEVLEVLPEVVYQDKKGRYNVAYGNLTALLIEALKEERQKRETLEKMYESMEIRLKRLESQELL